MAAAATFGLVLALTQHEVADLDGRLRTAITMAIVGALALIGTLTQDGLHWPNARPAAWGLAALTRAVRHCVHDHVHAAAQTGCCRQFADPERRTGSGLVMAWLMLGQADRAIQVVGALLVVGAVMALGLRRR